MINVAKNAQNLIKAVKYLCNFINFRIYIFHNRFISFNLIRIIKPKVKI